MSIEYYLFCKKETESIIYNIKSIRNSLEEKQFFLSLYENKEDLTEELNNIKVELNQYIIKQKETEKQLNMYREKIYSLCNHDFDIDLIEIAPDNCKYIEYCKLCEYTK